MVVVTVSAFTRVDTAMTWMWLTGGCDLKPSQTSRTFLILSWNLELSSWSCCTQTCPFNSSKPLYTRALVLRVVVTGGQRVSRWEQPAVKMLSSGRTASSRLLKPVAWLTPRLGTDGRAASTLRKGKSSLEQNIPSISLSAAASMKLIPKWRSLLRR